MRLDTTAGVMSAYCPETLLRASEDVQNARRASCFTSQNINVRTSSARARATMWLLNHPSTIKEVSDVDGMRVGSASRADHVDALVLESGESWRGRVWHPDRERFRRWLGHDMTARAGDGLVALAVEGCTGWRHVVEEIIAAGFEAHVAEPADTNTAHGRKNRAKTDRTDARLLRELLAAGELPE